MNQFRRILVKAFLIMQEHAFLLLMIPNILLAKGDCLFCQSDFEMVSYDDDFFQNFKGDSFVELRCKGTINFNTSKSFNKNN